MVRSMAARAAFLAVSLMFAACGSSSSIDGDAGALADGGAARDGGASLDGGAAMDGGAAVDAGGVDGGTRDAGVTDAGVARDGGSSGDGGLVCTDTTCPDVAGAYKLCANCGLLGRFGPYNVTLTQNMCSFSACVTLDGGAECGTGCVAQNGGLQLPLSVQGFMLQCSGTFDNGTRTGNLTCPLGALGSCAATLRAGLTTCQ